MSGRCRPPTQARPTTNNNASLLRQRNLFRQYLLMHLHRMHIQLNVGSVDTFLSRTVSPLSLIHAVSCGESSARLNRYRPDVTCLFSSDCIGLYERTHAHPYARMHVHARTHARTYVHMHSLIRDILLHAYI